MPKITDKDSKKLEKYINKEKSLVEDFNEIHNFIEWQLEDLENFGDILDEEMIKNDLNFKLKLKQKIESELISLRREKQTLIARMGKRYEGVEDDDLIDIMETFISESFETDYNNYDKSSFKEEYGKLLLSELEKMGELEPFSQNNHIKNKYFNSESTNHSTDESI